MRAMFEIGEVFHVSHVVDDLDAAMAWYVDVCGAEVWQRTEQAGVSLGFVVVGPVVLMPMAPVVGTPVAPARFLERFGPHLHSLALYVDDPVAAIEHLRASGLRLTGSAGGELTLPQDEIWTHPRETPCQFELFEPRSSTGDPRRETPGWSPRTDHPLGVLGAHYTAVAADAGAAAAQVAAIFNGRVVHETDRTPYATASAFVALGDTVVVELAQPLDGDSAAGRDLAAGTTFHAVTFRVADLERAVDHVTGRGVAVHRPAAGHAVLDPAASMGVCFRLTDRDTSDW